MAETPAQTLQRCVAKLNGAKSLQAEFVMKSGGSNVSGTLTSKGKKFALVSPAASTWYDGAEITAYSPASKEATVWRPTAGELAESNPLLYLSTASDYTVSAESRNVKGEIGLKLVPKRRNSGVKSVRVVINASTMLPKSITVAAGSGTMAVTIKSLRLNPAVSDASFRFPKAKYPGAKIVRL